MPVEINPYKRIWLQIKKSRQAKWAVGFIIFLCFLALFADIIANDKPLYCKHKGKSYYPAFTTSQDSLFNPKAGRAQSFSKVNWQELQLEYVIWPLIPYGSNDIIDQFHLNEKGKPKSGFMHPFKPQYRGNINLVYEDKGSGELLTGKFRHLLGTTQDKDILGVLIHGSRTALLLGLMVALIALMIGLTLGAIAGYYGDAHLRNTRGILLGIIIGIFLGYFYALHIPYPKDPEDLLLWDTLKVILVFSLCLIFGYLLGNGLSYIPYLKEESAIPIDTYLTRITEGLTALPGIMIIIALTAILPRNTLIGLIILLSISAWTAIARVTRLEVMRIRSLTYIEALKAMGASESRIIFRHILPNAFPPVLIIVSLIIASTILVVTNLAFLELGVPTETYVFWGELLTVAKQSGIASKWWVALFPGLMIFFTILSFNLLGETLRDALDPRNDIINS